MSVKLALLALLEQGPMYGYQLRAEFEERTGRPGLSTWARSTPPWPGSSETVWSKARGPTTRAISTTASPTRGGPRCRRGSPRRCLGPGQPPRDELAIKLALAVTVAGVDGATIEKQRMATIAALQDYTRLKRTGRAAAPTEPADSAWSLVLDSLVFDAEAEVRWLDHCEARLRRAAAEGTVGAVDRAESAEAPSPSPEVTR